MGKLSEYGKKIVAECEGKVKGLPRHKIEEENWGPLIISPALPSEAHPDGTPGRLEQFRTDFFVSHPREWPQWLLNCHLEHPAVSMQKDGTTVWLGGTFRDGIICPEDGKFLWLGGCMHQGIIESGTFMSGEFYYSQTFGGEMQSKCRWWDGVHFGGVFSGLWLGGNWVGGDWNGWWQKSKEPPYFNWYELMMQKRPKEE